MKDKAEHPKTICVDFDGVVHQYDSGWCGADTIPDPPVKGAIAGLYRLCADPEIDVAIHSARSSQEGGIQAMLMWLQAWDTNYRMKNSVPDTTPELNDMIRFPMGKPAAMCYIDDRGVTFDGDWDKITTELKDFQPWNKTDGHKT